MAEDTTAEEVKEETQVTTEGEGEATPEKEAASTVPTETPEEKSSEESEDIPVRSNASFIIERQKRTIEKLRSKPEVETESPDPVVERLDRIEQIAFGQADDRDLNSLFQSDPNAKKYEKRIKAYMQHELYKGVSPEVIYHHLDYQASRSKADSKRKAADLEAGQTKSVGSGIRDTRSKDTKTAEDIKRMTAAEFREYDREQQRLARS